MKTSSMNPFGGSSMVNSKHFERVQRSRRRFLGAVGAAPFALPFLRGLPAWAADDKRYLILLFTPNGVVRHLWGADTNGSDMSLRAWHKPLEPYKDKLAFVVGLQNKVAKAVGGTHEGGMSTLWSAGRAGMDASKPADKTIDQAIATHLMDVQKVGTKYASLELRARSPQDFEGKTIENRMIYRGVGDPIDPREDATGTRDSLFLGVSGGSTGTANPSDNAAASKLALRKKLAARVGGELDRITPKLCSEDKLQLEALRTGWNVLSGRLDGGGSSPAAGCQRPDNITGDKSYPKVTRDQIELLVMALACDLTRVASLQFSQARSPMLADWLGHKDDHHNISHMAPQPFTLGPMAPTKSDAEHPTQAQLDQYKQPIQQLTDINVFYATEVAYLCKRLSDISVGGGKSLLDQTVICWGNELDNGSNHDHFNMPFLLIGSAGGRIRTNQVVQYPVLDSYSNDGTAMRLHNDMLVTLARAMGVPMDKFGDPTYSKGPLTELLT